MQLRIIAQGSQDVPLVHNQNGYCTENQSNNKYAHYPNKHRATNNFYITIERIPSR